MRLSDRLASLRAYSRDEAVRDKALPLMQELHAAFDETVNLGLLEGIYIRYAHVLETTQALRWIVKPGARDMFHTTALGRAIVAHLPGEQQSRLVTKVCATLPARGRSAARQIGAGTRAHVPPQLCFGRGGDSGGGGVCRRTARRRSAEPLAAVSVSVPVHRFPVAQRTALIEALQHAGQRALVPT